MTSDYPPLRRKIAIFPKNLKTKCKLIEQLYKNTQYEVYEIENFNDYRLNKIKPDLIITTFCVNGNCDCSHYNLIAISIGNSDTLDLKLKVIKKIQCRNEFFLQEIKNLTRTSTYIEWLRIDLFVMISAHLKKTIQLLDENAFCTAEYISNNLGLSRVYFSRNIKNLLGVSFTYFRLWFRVAKVLYMIKNGNENINDIADHLNYSCSTNIYRDLARTIKIKPTFLILNKSLHCNIPSFFKNWHKKDSF